MRRAPLVFLVAGLCGRPAWGADSPPSSPAERLFQEGKALLDARQFAEACPRFAESHRLEPATSTLLALAMCHEGEGKTATAWAEYREAAERAGRERRPDREQAALEWAHDVEAKLSALTIVIPRAMMSVPGLTVKLDGKDVPRERWGAPLALDPGDHDVSITAQGKKPWVARLVLGSAGDRRTFTAHLVDDAPPPASTALPPPSEGSPESPTPRDTGPSLTIAQKAGLATAAVGVVAVGVGTFFGVRAVQRDDRSEAGCDGNACDSGAKQLRLDARADGDRATVGFVAGGVLVAAGAGLFVFGRQRGAERAHVRAAPVIGAREIGVALGGTF